MSDEKKMWGSAADGGLMSEARVAKENKKEPRARSGFFQGLYNSECGIKLETKT